ncbi:hypothetical protein PYCC9005_004443 [Savitreella phatthalungensis]
MSAAGKASELLPLERISDRFYIYEPDPESPAPDNGRNDKEPSLVLLFSFMGAALQHMRRQYVAGFHERFPHARIVLVLALPRDWRPFARFEHEYDTLLDLLAARCDITDLARSDALRGTYIHCMSNGGCWCLRALVNRAAIRTRASEVILRPRTVVFDSCPGRASYGVTVAAFTAALAPPPRKISAPSPDGPQATQKPARSPSFLSRVTRKLGLGLLVTIITLWYGFSRVKRFVTRRDVIEELRDQTVLAQLVATHSRTYIYSDGDKLIRSVDVEEHASHARSAGHADVRLEKFPSTSQHVVHSRTDPQRYWSIIEKAWRS